MQQAGNQSFMFNQMLLPAADLGVRPKRLAEAFANTAKLSHLLLFSHSSLLDFIFAVHYVYRFLWIQSP